MAWWQTALWWYGVITAIGLIFFPLAQKLLGRVFYDQGYAFSKVIGLLAVSYTIFVLGTVKILPFTQATISLLLVVFLILNVLLFLRQSKQSSQSQSLITRRQFMMMIFEELLFFSAFFFWVWVRGQEPSIKDLEKMMDFGFINSVLKARFFPPADIWMAGKTINYYYFGHLTGATLIKLSGIPSYKGYNLILALLFGLGIIQSFSLCFTLAHHACRYFSQGKKIFLQALIGGALGSFLVNLAGNLHTIYLFTTGYPNDNPRPFWQIFSWFHPSTYWYPNATRFIPFTIHEFPIYSYIVADLHGHVFDIPFVLLTIAVLFRFFIQNPKSEIRNSKQIINQLTAPMLIGFLTAIHYMTNAFDGPIYLLLTLGVFFFLYRLTRPFFLRAILLVMAFFLFSLPFSLHFSPFVSGIGVNCAPAFLTDLKKLGPFLFETDKCQTSPLWMLFVLWGFFWINFIFFIIVLLKNKNRGLTIKTDAFVLLLFALSLILTLIPEFFYIKDIYPAHFRANTMFKLGYQAFIMMSLASAYIFIRLKQKSTPKIFWVLYLIVFFLVSLYPGTAISSYYGKLKKTPELDGRGWISLQYPEYLEMIEYLNKKAAPNAVILEAQGDSYTTYNVVSAYTGLATVAGWWVHEWLWRGASAAVGDRMPEVQTVYEGEDLQASLTIIKKYQVKYIIVGSNEREKYPKLREEKLARLARRIFSSVRGNGAIYQVD